VSALASFAGVRGRDVPTREGRTDDSQGDLISILSAGSTPIAWQAGQAQVPLRRHDEDLLEPAAKALDVSPDDLKDQRTQKLMWGDRSAIGQSTPWDAGRNAPASGQLVDDYA
jgi:hypothetical protein